MHWFNFPLVKATILYVLGIALAPLVSLSFKNIVVVAALNLAFGILLFVSTKKAIQPKSSYGVLILSLFFMLGVLNQKSRLPQNNHLHYANYIIDKTSARLELRISKSLKSTDFYDQYQAKIENYKGQKTQGRILLQIKKDQDCRPLDTGQVLLIKHALQEVNGAKNPYQFDYKKYMQAQHIYHKLSLNGSQFVQLSNHKKGLSYWANLIQNKYATILDSKIGNANAAAVLKALLVGDKEDLDTTIKKSFANAGVLHLLAVSGLHVGIVLVLVQSLLSFLKRLPFGTIIIVLTSLLAIWGFAAVTGFSPSVVRAAFMFSLFTIGNQLKRGHHSINTLFVSMLIMLCVDPFYLYQVGFQLSYVAVFFILLIYPKLVAIWVSKYVVLRKLWQLSCVSVAAQLGVLPLSLYYFHEFPALFLISNLILVPMIGLLLSSGLILCSLQIFINVPNWCFEVLDYWVFSINSFAFKISQFDFAVVTNIAVTHTQLAILYCGIMASYFALINDKKYPVRVLSIFWCLLLLSIVLNRHSLPQEQLLVVNSYRQTIVSHKYLNDLSVYSDALEPNESALEAYEVANHIENKKVMKLVRYFDYNKFKIYIPIKDAASPPQAMEVDVLLLTNNCKINLERWILNLNPSLIIADASSFKNNVLLWQNTAQKLNVAFYDTALMGAYRFAND